MTRYFKATFSDGRVRTRCSEGRIYTHAYIDGFASRYDLAVKAARGGEVVPVVEISRGDYRMHGKETR